MTLPIKEHPTHIIYDSSKLKCFCDCPRQFFYQYILGWRLDIPNHDTYFGESIHKSREYSLLHGYEDITGAYDAFLNYYRKEFSPESDELYKPKNPANAFNMITQFANERMLDLEENEVVELNGQKMLEISGTVPIDEKRVLHYRMDSIMRRLSDGKIFSWDWKTTKRFSRQWREDFHLGIQNGTYTHCLYCMFPIEEVLGIEFYGICFEQLTKGSKNRPAGYYVSFEQVPAFKTPEQMNVWLWNTIDILNNLEREMDRLYHCSEDDIVMMSFPMNPNSCTKYFGCAYHDFCLSWTNPLQRSYEIPIGFREEFWNPSAMDTTVKKNLEWR
jgi:hypothetical protein